MYVYVADYKSLYDLIWYIKQQIAHYTIKRAKQSLHSVTLTICHTRLARDSRHIA